MKEFKVHLPVMILAIGFSVDGAEDLLNKAVEAWNHGKPEEALKLTGQAIEVDPKLAKAIYFRGILYSRLDKHEEAIKDFDKTLELDPKSASAYQSRGIEHFRLGHIKESIADFDRYIKLKPEEEPQHWQRGIAYYYARQFKDGQKQFELHETVNPEDVENVVWHFLCKAQLDGIAKARAAMLKKGKDSRVPMLEIYDLFAGTTTPDKVLEAAHVGKPSEEALKGRLFYAHLYIGLYYEAEGDKKKALEYLEKAAKDYFVPGYMGDVAKVHLRLREKGKK
jgi:lipoprotein NlpI